MDAAVFKSINSQAENTMTFQRKVASESAEQYKKKHYVYNSDKSTSKAELTTFVTA